MGGAAFIDAIFYIPSKSTPLRYVDKFLFSFFDILVIIIIIVVVVWVVNAKFHTKW